MGTHSLGRWIVHCSRLELHRLLIRTWHTAWRPETTTISYEMAVKNIALTCQLNREGENTSLAKHLGTNDSILRYRRIKSHFFTDTFFVTKETKSAWGHTCMQFFVSDKVFVKVYPMKLQCDYPAALLQFAWYERVYFYDESSVARFPFLKAMLGRVLGPAKNKGNEMTKWCLKSNGKVVPRRTVKCITAEQLAPSNAVDRW